MVGISDIIIKPGLINVDFADVQSIMGEAGPRAHGDRHRRGQVGARKAAAIAALSSPLIDFPISQATGIVFTITGAART